MQADIAGYVQGLVSAACAVPDSTLLRREFCIGRMTMRARFSNPGLAKLYSSRLFPSDRPPDCHVDVLETGRLGWPPLARWSDSSCDRQCFHRALGADLLAAYPHTPRLWEVASVSMGRVVQVTETVDDLPVWDSGAPLRTPIHWACVDRGWRLVHAATLGIGRRAVLIVGPGGVGKSGTTLAGMANGLQTVGDDYVLVEPGNPPIARPVYRLLKQDRRGIARIPGLEARLLDSRPNWQGKLEFDPERVFPGAMAESQEIVAIVTPVIARAGISRIEPLQASETLPILTRAILTQFPGERDSGFLFSVGLSKKLPAFRLVLSESPEEVAGVLRQFVEEFGA